jgi:hypothetical protein
LKWGDEVVDDRRSEERYEIRAGVAVRRNKDHSEDPELYLSRNISSKGIFLELNGNIGFETGKVVYLKIDLGKLGEDGRPLQVVTRGNVVRCEDEGVAIRFNGRSNFVMK